MTKIDSKTEWSSDWAIASENFEENDLEPHAREELRGLILNAILRNDARELQRFFDPIRQELFRVRHREGLKRLAESEKRYPRNGPRKCRFQ
jgi:hypothetical protein